VYLAYGDLDVSLSDNYFDLVPGEETAVHLATDASLPQLQQALKVTSLTDAFFDERPSYREHVPPDGNAGQK
jgi:beta-mannosidase